VTAPKKEAEAMAWFYLFLAGLFEVVWAIGLKYPKAFRGRASFLPRPCQPSAGFSTEPG